MFHGVCERNIPVELEQNVAVGRHVEILIMPCCTCKNKSYDFIEKVQRKITIQYTIFIMVILT